MTKQKYTLSSTNAYVTSQQLLLFRVQIQRYLKSQITYKLPSLLRNAHTIFKRFELSMFYVCDCGFAELTLLHMTAKAYHRQAVVCLIYRGVRFIQYNGKT